MTRLALCTSGQSPDRSNSRRFTYLASTSWQITSRNCPDPTEWHLHPLIAQRLFQMWSRPQVDLFTYHRNHQLPLWFCWAGHPQVASSNVLSQPWSGLYLYAYPPISLLKRTDQDQGGQAEEAIVITPRWPRRSWYHLQMACEIPLLLPCRQDLLSQHLPDKGILYHTELETLQLMVWKLSSIPSRTRVFLRQLSEQSLLPPVTPLERCTIADERASLAGVVRGSESH